MVSVMVIETFTSLQGESTFQGLPCFFIRLAGCNLKCSYCDTSYAAVKGREARVETLVDLARKSKAFIVEITGGEPLIQKGFEPLAVALRDKSGKRVLVETNGSRDISAVPENVTAIMDVKCPGSGEHEEMDLDNLSRLRPYDEVKFVISDRNDYEWARNMTIERELAAKCRAVLFSPVSGRCAARELGQWMVRDGTPARLQIQLHKALNLR